MNRYILLLGIFVASNAMADQTRFRDNDPFLFCHDGQINPLRCWKPIYPFTGAYWPDPTCNPPNSPYGRPWTSDDYESLSDYERICPQALKPGDWDPKGGSPNLVPTFH